MQRNLIGPPGSSMIRISTKKWQPDRNAIGLNLIQVCIRSVCFPHVIESTQEGWCKYCHTLEHASGSCPSEPPAEKRQRFDNKSLQCWDYNSKKELLEGLQVQTHLSVLSKYSSVIQMPYTCGQWYHTQKGDPMIHI